ncbi:MAG: PD-(D/E)XK nuclease family protein [Anaerolineae bacterium]|nr:PD-(D/E)XK nuclease family protein [Anaerolineae bacterium]
MPETFRFTQQSLQDYVECNRRFQLRHVLMQPWPALVTGTPGEYERMAERGADFHRLAHQRALGFDLERIEATIDDDELRTWWHTFLAHPPAGVPEAVRRAEVILSAPMPQVGDGPGPHRLVAKIDLLAAEPRERMVVVDWKTVRRRPGRDELGRRLQTRVYRYLAVEAGAAVHGGVRPKPEQVEMIYWFAAHGGHVEHFGYNAAQHAADRDDLAALAAEIASRQSAIWPLTDDDSRCRLCNYRSLCERDVEPAFPDELPDDVEGEAVMVDLEQVAEIEF